MKIIFINSNPILFFFRSTVDLLVEVYKDTIDDPTPVFTSVQYSVNADGILEAGTTVLDVRATVPNGSPVFYNVTGPEDTLIRGFNIDRETVSFEVKIFLF